MSEKVTKLVSPASSVHKCRKNVFLPNLTVFTAYYNCMSKNVGKTHISTSFCAQVSQIVFLADLTVFAAYYNCMSEKVTKLISP